jgi:hypothetical protein
MNLNRIVNKYFECWKYSAVMIKQPQILLPFLVIALGQLLVLTMLTLFSKPPISLFMVPLVQIAGGEGALHYPAHYVALPYLYELVTLPLMMVFGFILFGWAVFMIADRLDQNMRPAKYYAGTIVWNIPAFVIIGIFFIALSTGIPAIVTMLSHHIHVALWRKVLERSGWLLGLAAEIFLIYSLLFMKLYQDTPLSAIRRSMQFAKKRLVLTVMIFITVSIIHKPFEYAASHSDVIALKFKPELLFYVLLGGIIIEIFTNYFIFVSTTYLAVGRKQRWL